MGRRPTQGRRDPPARTGPPGSGLGSGRAPDPRDGSRPDVGEGRPARLRPRDRGDRAARRHRPGHRPAGGRRRSDARPDHHRARRRPGSVRDRRRPGHLDGDAVAAGRDPARARQRTSARSGWRGAVAAPLDRLATDAARRSSPTTTCCWSDRPGGLTGREATALRRRIPALRRRLSRRSPRAASRTASTTATWPPTRSSSARWARSSSTGRTGRSPIRSCRRRRCWPIRAARRTPTRTSSSRPISVRGCRPAWA